MSGMALGCALAVVGLRVLNPFDVSWISGDTATEYIAWSFLRREPGPSLPLGWSGALGYPLGVSTSLLDPMPGLAVLGQVASGLLPRDVQYFGPYFVLCLVLQLHFGRRIARRVLGPATVACWLGGAFFMVAPAFLWRSIGHFSLTSQWIILAALDQLLLAALQRGRPRGVWTAALCLMASAINPYIAVMTLLVCCAAHIQAALFQRGAGAAAWRGIGGAIGTAGAGLVLFGFVTTLEPSQYVGGGYGRYAMNLVAPVDPGRPGGLLLAPWALPPEQQMEGYNYLGLGLLLLGLFAVAWRPGVLRGLFARRAVVAVAVFGVSLALALSAQASAGRVALYALPLPEPVMGALAALRGSGRLFWPGYYLVFAGILAAAGAAFRGWRLPAVLGLALLVQVLDLMPLRAMIHETWRSSVAPGAPADPAWHELGRGQAHLVVLPAWQCAAPLQRTPGEAAGFAVFGALALEQGMTINSFYASRYTATQRDFFCVGQMEEVLQRGLQDDTAYVFPRDAAAWVASLAQGSRFCRFVEEHILCSAVTGRAGADPALRREAVVLTPGRHVSFAEGDPSAARLLGPGWSPAEPWGSWADGGVASLVFAVEDGGRDLAVSLLLRAFVRPGHPVQRVAVAANGMRVAEQEIRHADPMTLRVVVPAAATGGGLVRLDFHCPDAVSPAALGLADDRRALSIGLIGVRIDDQAE